MALGTLGTALATSAITTGVPLLAEQFFGGDTKRRTRAIREFQPSSFAGGGLRGTFGPGGLNVVSDPVRQGLVGELASRFNEQAGLTRGLRERVAPGVSELREARLNRIRDAERRSLGNLRENLALRRVSGSSFGADALSRAASEFGRLESDVAGETFLQELDLTNRLIQQEFDQRRSAINAQLGELNLGADVASRFSANINNILARNAQIDAALAAEEAANRGQFFGRAAENLAGGLFGGRNRTTPTRTPQVSGMVQRLPRTDITGRILGGI